MLKLRDLYGQSYAHDFQFTNPDSIKDAVKRYNLQRAAERDECKKDRDTHKLGKPRFCKLRNTGRDVVSMVTSRDLDVETQVSLGTKHLSHMHLNNGICDNCNCNCCSCSSSDGSDVQSDGGVAVQVNGVQRLAGGADIAAVSQQSVGRGKKRNRKSKRGAAKQRLPDSDPYASHIEGLHREVCAELKFMSQSQSELAVGLVKRKLKQRRIHKQPIKPKPMPTCKPVESQPTQKKIVQRPKPLTQPESPNNHSESEMILQRLKQVLNADQPADTKQVSYEDYPQPESQWVDIIPSPMMPQALAGLVCDPLHRTPSAECLLMEQADREALFAEDSDLEQELADRPGYMRYIERLPYKLSEQDLNATRCQPEKSFVELGPHPQWISLQRSLKPMHYTSQRSDSETCTLCGHEEQQLTGSANGAAIGGAVGTAAGRPAIARQQQPPAAKRYRGRQASGAEMQPKVGSMLRTQKATKSPTAARRRKPKQKFPLESPTTTKTFSRQPGGRDKEQKTTMPTTAPVTQPQTQTQSQSQSQSQSQNQAQAQTEISPNVTRRRKTRAVIYTRSLENLKFQKMSIYNKISLTQERIITALDRLQSSLLQLPMISSGNQEKQRRERNAFNFCVRFSRNFLYPLRGMIEDVHCTPVASFNSATSNEASQRVVCVYVLMYQSIGRYQRQIRYFLLDKVPQKLSALIEMMYTLTNVCLDKGVLDRQDPVVECLQQRCTSFLTFIEDMQEQRFQLARETHRRLQRRVHTHCGHGHGRGHPRPGMHERYDLKMCLNDLKLYEPHLVPKECTEKRRQRGCIRKPKLIAESISHQRMPGVILSLPSEVQQEHPTEDVPTHIECVQCGDHRNELTSDFEEPSDDQKHQLSNIMALLQQRGQEKRELHQQLLEAMKHVTKSQVREVLDPLVRSLGAMLDKKMKPDKG